MRGSAVFRTGVAPGGALAGPWVQNPLWTAARAVPSLDLRFADNKSLVDATTGAQLVTFTRASSGTFVGSDGVLRSARTNLLLQSEDFGTTWTTTNYVLTTNAIASPSGTTTADKLAKNTLNATTQVTQNVTCVANTAYNFSCFVKAAELSKVGLREGSGTGSYVTFDLSTATVVSTSGAAGTITPFANGWYRVTMQMTTGAAQTTYGCRIIPLPDTYTSGNPLFSFAGDGTSGIYFWGAQLEQSSTVGEYIPTTSTINSAPRFDHNPTTGESLGLLVEEQRTNTLLQSNQFDTSWTLDTGNPTISLVSQTAPDGGAQSWKLTEGTSTGFQDIFQTGVSNSSGSSVYSVYAKAAERFKLSLRESTSTGTIALFDLSAGSVVVVSGGGTPSPTATITPVKNGWYRCSVLFNQSTTSNRTFRIFVVEDAETTANGSIASRTGDGTSGFYLWGAQLEAGSKATSYIPTTTATVTRAADVASITGSNFGTTRTNLLVRSEEFDDAAWGKFQSTITANTVIAPDGTLTADKLVENTATTTHIITEDSAVTAGATYTFSVFFKAAERTFAQLRCGATSQFSAIINLSTGEVTDVVGSTTSSVISVGNGWWRFSISFAADTTPLSVRIGVVINSTPPYHYTGDGTSGIYLWGAQLEVGSAVTPYIQSPSVFTSRASSGTYVGGNGLIQTATTNEARYDHDPISLIGKGLLLEEARTNLSLYSEDFGDAVWSSSAASISTNTTAAPDGTTTADTVNSSGTAVVSQSFTKAASAITYTGSLFVKGSATDFSLTIDDGVPINRGRARFNLSTGTLGSVTNEGTFTGTTSTITLFPNDWYRLTVTTTTNTLTTARLRSFWTGAGTSINFWGAQLEIGAFATSYIPTTTATVTRAADISTSVATSVFESSWYRQDEGTMFVEAAAIGRAASSPLVQFQDASATDRIQFRQNAPATDLAFQVIDGASASSGLAATAFQLNAFYKGAIATKTSDHAATINSGTISASSTPSTMPTVDQLRFNTTSPSLSGSHLVRRLTYWPVRLSNEVLQRITQ
jgi:hypothetical protein